jgi:hypothetical protein
MLSQPTKMKKPVEIWQAIIATLLLLVTVVTIIINQSNRITRDEAEILHLEENKTENAAHFNELNMSIKEVNNELVSIRVLLEDKQNRQ